MQKSGCMCIDFRTVANRLTRLYDDALAPSGLTVTQFSQLNTIQTLGHPTLNELSDAVGLDRSTLGRNVGLLEKLGFVSTAAGQDARTRVIKITASGRSAFKRAAPLWHGVQTQLTGALGADGNTHLDQLLTQVNDICAAQTTR